MNHSKIEVFEACDQGLGVMYRIEATHYGSLDEYGETVVSSYTKLHATQFPIRKVTKCGKWIQVGAEKKFVLDNSNKRFACETLEKAIESFKARKLRQIRILKAQLADAEEQLAMVTVVPAPPLFEHMPHPELMKVAGAVA